ncbi:MAG TPA: HPF/RaiA family ribosome-associated protein [Woeseiaceae bacterium]
MQTQLQVHFRNMDQSAALEEDIRARAAKLEQFFDRIISCHVTVEAPHKHHNKGIIYHVRIAMTVPGRELAINRDHSENPAHEDPYVAVRDAFDSARRLLQDHSRKMRDQSKGGPKAADVLAASNSE